MSPNATHADVVGKIIYLRQNYHFGPSKIAMYLKRYHDVKISHSGVWRILKRLDMSRLPTSQRYKRLDKRWKRYEKQLPGHQVQIDVKFIEPIKGAPPRRYYQYTAIDDCTRLRVLRIYPRLNQKTAIQFVDYVLEKLPFVVQVIQTDNGSANSAPRSTTTCSTRGSGTSTSNPGPPPQRQGGEIPPDRRRGVLPASWTGPSSTTPRSSTTSSKSGRTTTTTIAPTAALRPNTLRATKAKDPGPRVSSDRKIGIVSRPGTRLTK